jgi:hypothetical protein
VLNVVTSNGPSRVADSTLGACPRISGVELPLGVEPPFAGSLLPPPAPELAPAGAELPVLLVGGLPLARMGALDPSCGASVGAPLAGAGLGAGVAGVAAEPLGASGSPGVPLSVELGEPESPEHAQAQHESTA